MAEFLAGFKDLADRLDGRAGEPLADEYILGPTTRQPTTTGEMIWTDGGPALFIGQNAPVDGAPALVYDPTAPVQLQYRDWSCAIVSTHWALSSLGFAIEREDLVADMTPWPVSPAVGCLDASGAGLVRYLGETYDLPARNRRPASWAEVVAVAGQYPCLIGGGGWYHWSAVRDTAPGVLLLANPAPGWRGIYQSMNRSQFESWLGPFALVEVLV